MYSHQLRLVFPIVVFLLITTCFDVAVNGDAWLIGEGEYKFSGTYMFFDKRTRDYLAEQGHKLDDYERKLIRLRKFRIELQKLIEGNLQQNKATNFDEAVLRTTDQVISELEEKKANLIALDDLKLANLGVIYGVSKNTNVSLSINYEFEQFFKKELSGNDVAFRVSYNLIDYDNYLVTFIPELNYNNSYAQPERWSVGAGIFIGHSKKFSETVGIFSEIGIKGSKMITNQSDRTHQVGLSMQEGISFNDDLLIYNYQFFERINNGRAIQDISYFEQFSVAKEIKLGKLAPAATISLGYYWKGSFKYHYPTLSGPVISIWSKF